VELMETEEGIYYGTTNAMNLSLLLLEVELMETGNNQYLPIPKTTDRFYYWKWN